MFNMSRGFLWQSLSMLSALATVILFMGFIETESASSAVIFTVDTASDIDDTTADCNCGSGAGQCSLRAAIKSANACAGGQTIQFSAPWYINVTSQLPTLVDNYMVISATDKWMTGAGIPYPGVVLDGQGIAFNGLVITASHCAVYGLQIVNFGQNGVMLYDGASFNEIGGSGYRERNIISHNSGNGVRIQDASSSGNDVWYNYIGTNPEGTTKSFPGFTNWRNSKHGVSVWDAEANTISYNLISGNDWSGVAFDFVNSGSIENNQIGMDIFNNSLGNDYYGVHVANDSDPIIQENTIGFNRRGIYVDGGSNPVVFKNAIYSNTASTLIPPDGGAILVKGSGTTASIEENNILSNTARYGGGLALEEDAYAWIYDNLIQNNHASPTIDGEIRGGGIYINDSGAWVKKNQIISNTAINGSSFPAYGGGISLDYANSVEIIENEIRGNTTSGSPDRGGGINLFQAGQTNILRNSITENHANSGGCGLAINNALTGSQTWVEGNWVSKNIGGGSAIVVLNTDYVTLTNNVIANNAFIGLFFNNCGVHNHVIHNTIVGNTFSGIVLNNTGMGFHNNIVALNDHYGVELLGSWSSVETRNDVWGNLSGATNVSGHTFYLEVDPQFFDTTHDHYQIQPTSPCMDDCAYDHSSDTSFNGLSRPQGAGCDIGAYEMSQPIFMPMIYR